jgi:hypothetical protein
MRIRVVASFVIVMLSAWTLCVGTTGAQILPSVTVAVTRDGGAVFGCTADSSVVIPPQFLLTRTGDTTAGLTVALAWTGPATTDIVFSPPSVQFLPGVVTATVTAVYTPSAHSGNLTLTVVSGTGYEPGDPPAATALFVVATVACVTTPPSPPEPLIVEPAFTG